MCQRESIQTERLCLHSICDQDKDAMVEMFFNAEITQTYMIPEYQSKEEAIKLFDRFKELSVSKDHFVYGIYLNDHIIGFINDVEIKEKEIEIGYVIHPAEKNQGYATEVLTEVIKELFAMGFTVVKAGAFEENLASMRVMEKSGMHRIQQEDTIEYRGKVHRCCNYEILRG